MEGVPTGPDDMAHVIMILDAELRKMSQSAHLHNVESWQRSVAVLKQKVASKELRLNDPDFGKDVPLLPAHLTNQTITAPLGMRVVTLTPPTESPMTPEQLTRREDMLFAIMGVSRMAFAPPEVMGNSSHEQIQDFAKGVSELRKSELHELVRIYVATLTLLLYGPVVLDYITTKAVNKASASEIRRQVDREEQAIFRASEILELPLDDSDSSSESATDADTESDQSDTPRSRPGRQRRRSRSRSAKKRGDQAQEGDPKKPMFGFVTSGPDGLAMDVIPYEGLAPRKTSEEITERDYIIASLVASMGVVVAVTPPLSLAQKRASDQAWEEGFLPKEERAKIFASLMGIPVDRLNIEGTERDEEKEAEEEAEQASTADSVLKALSQLVAQAPEKPGGTASPKPKPKPKPKSKPKEPGGKKRKASSSETSAKKAPGTNRDAPGTSKRQKTTDASSV
jgi:hypothetical protein